jgi:hypothetical protein
VYAELGNNLPWKTGEVFLRQQTGWMAVIKAIVDDFPIRRLKKISNN